MDTTAKIHVNGYPHDNTTCCEHCQKSPAIVSVLVISTKAPFGETMYICRDCFDFAISKSSLLKLK